MRLAYRFECREHTDELLSMCKVSKDLYNQALYAYNQAKENEGRYLTYYDLAKLMPSVTNLEGNTNYRLLKAQVAQQTIKKLMSNIDGFYKSMKLWKADPSKFKGMPKFPKYLKRNSRYQVTFTNQSCSIRNGILSFSRSVAVHIPQWEKYRERIEKFQQVRVLPKDGYAVVEIVYETGELNETLDRNRVAAIDLGVSNLVTMVTDFSRPVIYSGKQLKAKNQWFNKQLSKLKSAADKCNGRKTTKKIKTLYANRERKMHDAMHKISRHIVGVLVKNGVGRLVMGHNSGWKDSTALGKVNNQNFTQIPYDKLISMLRYKCACCGILFEVTEESYTSKCDALAFEEICKHEKYLGKRIKRGLFQSSAGKLVNADVNGALNIMRKVVGDSGAVRGIADSGRLFRPVRVKDIYSLSEMDFISLNEI